MELVRFFSLVSLFVLKVKLLWVVLFFLLVLFFEFVFNIFLISGKDFIEI